MATMTMILSVSLFANFLFVARSDLETTGEPRPKLPEHPTGYELYV